MGNIPKISDRSDVYAELESLRAVPRLLLSPQERLKSWLISVIDVHDGRGIVPGVIESAADVTHAPSAGIGSSARITQFKRRILNGPLDPVYAAGIRSLVEILLSGEIAYEGWGRVTSEILKSPMLIDGVTLTEMLSGLVTDAVNEGQGIGIVDMIDNQPRWLFLPPSSILRVTMRRGKISRVYLMIDAETGTEIEPGTGVPDYDESDRAIREYFPDVSGWKYALYRMVDEKTEKYKLDGIYDTFSRVLPIVDYNVNMKWPFVGPPVFLSQASLAIRHFDACSTHHATVKEAQEPMVWVAGDSRFSQHGNVVLVGNENAKVHSFERVAAAIGELRLACGNLRDSIQSGMVSVAAAQANPFHGVTSTQVEAEERRTGARLNLWSRLLSDFLLSMATVTSDIVGERIGTITIDNDLSPDIIEQKMSVSMMKGATDVSD